MNPIKALYETIKWVVVDLFETLRTAVDIVRHPDKYNDRQKELFTELTTGWGRFLKNNWWLFLLFALVFAGAWFAAAKYYQNQCNIFIYENYIEKGANTLIQGINNSWKVDIPNLN